LTIAASLATLKVALGPKSERDIICAGVAASFGVGVHEWLDVGVGDGRSLSKILAQLAEGRIRFNVIGVDPEAMPGLVCEPTNTFSVFDCFIEEFAIDRKFDVINVRQSAYYFENPPLILAELIRTLRDGGKLFVTHWTQDCFLYQLHFLIAEELGLQPSALALEELNCMILRDTSRVVDQVAVVVDTIDLQAVLSDPSVFEATLNIAARRLPASQLTNAARTRLADAMATRWPRQAVRANGVLSLTAAPIEGA